MTTNKIRKTGVNKDEHFSVLSSEGASGQQYAQKPVGEKRKRSDDDSSISLEADSLFDAIVRALNSKGITDHTIKSLRLMCRDYAIQLRDRCEQNPTLTNWIETVLNNKSVITIDFDHYLNNIKFTACEAQTQGKYAIWGDREVDGRIICEKLGIHIHVKNKEYIECSEHESEPDIEIEHLLITADEIIKVDEADPRLNEQSVIHLKVCNYFYEPLVKYLASHTRQFPGKFAESDNPAENNNLNYSPSNELS